MIGFQTAWSYHSKENGKRDFLTTGNTDIDQLIGKSLVYCRQVIIGGGITYGTITEISGEAGSGKSQFW